ncbi:hypothetical protein, partial [Cronobacter sakazakii]|uniref:hypothetical protein n=1 Tax=Cronobacter sakazakii TaxID=28141 RepID=UPI003F650942
MVLRRDALGDALWPRAGKRAGRPGMRRHHLLFPALLLGLLFALALGLSWANLNAWLP